MLGIGAALLLLVAPQTAPVPGVADAGKWLSSDRAFRFVHSLAEGKKVTVVTLGTSLTGGRWRWPDVVVGEWLQGEYPGQVRLVNLGVGASASRYVPGPMSPSAHEGKCGLDRAREVAEHRPDVVFVEFAVNDAYVPYGISLEESVRNMEEIFEHLRTSCPGAERVLLTTNPVKDTAAGDHASQRPQLPAYLDAHLDLAERLGVPALNVHPEWLRLLERDPRRFDELVSDGIHPTLEGYREVLLPAARRELQSRPALFMDELDALLGPHGVSLRVMICRYEEARLLGRETIGLGSTSAMNARWSCSLEPTAAGADFLELTLRVELEEGSLPSGGIAVAMEFAGWDPGNYVMLPAAVYGGNRHEIVDRGYAQGIDPEYLFEREIPRMSVPIPHLSPEIGRPSRLEVSACNLATPAFCVWDRRSRTGFILLAEQGLQRGGDVIDHGFLVEESTDGRRASLVLNAPGVREERPLFVGFAPSPDRGADFHAGDLVRLRLRLYAFPAGGIPDLLERFMAERKALTGPNRPRDLVPLSQTLSWMTERIDGRWHDGEELQFYCPENARWISFGWVGGLINTYPMLALGDDLHLDRVARTFDFAIPRAQGESGFFHGTLDHRGEVLVRHPYRQHPGLVLTRKNGDVLYWMVKQFMLLRAQGRGEAIEASWESSIRRLADAFVRTWRADGQWGKMVDCGTGKVAEFGTCGGVMAIGGLALASRYYAEPDYLAVAREAARYHYERDFVATGQTSGGCGDILHNADSESAAGFMTALVTLYEISGEPEWLERARHLAHLVATWTTSYDYVLPGDSELRRLDARLAGVYWASTQNKHGAPGICTQSGDALFKLYRATGQRVFAELLRDIVHAHAESIRPGGLTNERLTYCDAEHRGYRGDHVTGWCETNGALMAVELPGIYARSDTDELFVLDHVEVSRRQGVLSVRNPTPHEARVRLLVEDARGSAEPLGENAFLDWPVVVVPAGTAREIDLRDLPSRDD